MELEKQVVSLELAKRLKELGVKQESFFQWEVSGSRSYIRWNQYAKCGCEFMTTANLKFRYSAFTVAELGEMLPRQIGRTHWTEHIRGKVSGWVSFLRYVEYEKTWDIESFEADTEADARAKMLIYLLENKLITV